MTNKPLKNSGQQQHFGFKLIQGKFDFIGVGICEKVRLEKVLEISNQEQKSHLQHNIYISGLEDNKYDFFEQKLKDENGNDLYHHSYFFTNEGYYINGSKNTVGSTDGIIFEEGATLHLTYDFDYRTLSLYIEKNDEISVIDINFQFEEQQLFDKHKLEFYPCIFSSSPGDRFQILDDIQPIYKEEKNREISRSFRKKFEDSQFNTKIQKNKIQILNSIKDNQNQPLVQLGIATKPIILEKNKQYVLQYVIYNDTTENSGFGILVQNNDKLIIPNNQNTVLGSENQYLEGNFQFLTLGGYYYNSLQREYHIDIFKFDRVLTNELIRIEDIKIFGSRCKENKIYLGPGNIVDQQLAAFLKPEIEKNMNIKLEFVIESMNKENKSIAIGLLFSNNKDVISTEYKVLQEKSHFLLDSQGYMYTQQLSEQEQQSKKQQVDFNFEVGDKLELQILWKEENPNLLHCNKNVELRSNHKLIKIIPQRNNSFNNRQLVYYTLESNEEDLKKTLADTTLSYVNYPLEKFKEYEIQFEIESLPQKITNLHQLGFGIVSSNNIQKNCIKRKFIDEENGIYIVSKQYQREIQQQQNPVIPIEKDMIITLKLNGEQNQLIVSNGSQQSQQIIEIQKSDKQYYFCVILNGISSRINLLNFQSTIVENQIIYKNINNGKTFRQFFGNFEYHYGMVLLKDQEDEVHLRNAKMLPQKSFEKLNFKVGLQHQYCFIKQESKGLASITFDIEDQEDKTQVLQYYFSYGSNTKIYPVIGVSNPVEEISLEPIEIENLKNEQFEIDIEMLKENLEQYNQKINLEKKRIRQIDLEILKYDSNMRQIMDKFNRLIVQIQIIQRVYTNQILPMIDNFSVNEFDTEAFVNKFIPIIVTLVSTTFDDSTSNFVSTIGMSLVMIVNKDFQKVPDEFYQILQIDPQYIPIVKECIHILSQSSYNPIKILEKRQADTINFIHAKSNDPQFRDLDRVKQKLEEQNLSPQDMFKVADIDGNNELDMREFRLFFKKMGIELSDHRVQEIFSYAKQETQEQSSTVQTLDMEEFIKGYDYLQKQSIFLSLESLGINMDTLYIWLAVLIVILILIFIFIYIGVKAFAIPGTFGAIVNSIFPVAGGGFLSQEKSKDQKKNLEIENIKKVVEDSIARIQASI